ncbi:MAG: Hint domain-containing protein, partial [Paracoccaceae bacterium]
MTDHSFVCFQWTGTHYNATYTQSHTAVIRDDDATYEGHGDNDERISVDGGAFTSSQSQPYCITVGFQTVDGENKEEEFNFFQTAGKWYFVPSEGSDFSVGARLGNYQSHTLQWNYTSALCFAGGTWIDTPSGPVRVEDLRAGDLVCVASGVPQPLRMNLVRHLTADDVAQAPALAPVCITRGALGNGLPHQDLRVSRQHRMMIRSQIAHRMFGTDEVLVAAIRLTDCPGIHVERSGGDLSYHHLVFDAHQVVLANGAPSESLYPGPQALRTLPRALRDEVLTLFPGLARFGEAL